MARLSKNERQQLARDTMMLVMCQALEALTHDSHPRECAQLRTARMACYSNEIAEAGCDYFRRADALPANQGLPR